MTEPDLNPRQVSSARELHTLAELIDVEYREVSARRRDDVGQVPSPVDDVEVSVQVGISSRLVEVRCLGHAETGEATFTVEVIGKFATSEPITVEEEALSSYVGAVALPSIYPFVRESIFQAAAKLRVEPPLLSILRTAHVKVDMPAQGRDRITLDEPS